MSYKAKLKARVRHFASSVRSVYSRLVSSTSTERQRARAEFKRLVKTWVCIDGSSVDGPFLSSSRRWVMIVNNRWWAALKAERKDSAYPMNPHTVMEPLLLKLSDRWESNITAVLDPNKRVVFDVENLRQWADAGQLKRCPDCEGFCEDMANPSDEFKYAAFRSIDRIKPWGVRVHRDVLSALLRTVPASVKWIWGTIDTIPNTAGGANVTFVSPDVTWCGQMLSHIVPTCEQVHPPIDLSCKACSVSDSELWRMRGEGLC